MKLNEMILVTENWKGTEINALMTFEDYKKKILFAMSENMDEESKMDANQQAYLIAGFQECVKLQQRS